LNKILLCLLAAALSSALSACATDPATDGAAASDASAAAAADDGEERVYITGSIIPRKPRAGEGVQTVAPDAILGGASRHSTPGSSGGSTAGP